jgi:hypothetical protein
VVARPQGVEGSGTASQSDTLGSPWPPLAIRHFRPQCYILLTSEPDGASPELGAPPPDDAGPPLARHDLRLTRRQKLTFRGSGLDEFHGQANHVK